jgi:hypothetical protein
MNSTGYFIYSGLALGGLIYSSARAAGTDTYGNAYFQGDSTYNAGTEAMNINQFSRATARLLVGASPRPGAWASSSTY